MLVATVAVALAWPSLRDAAFGLLPAFPYAVFAAGILLALRFERGRVVVMIALLALAEQIMHRAAGSGAGDAGHVVLDAMAVLLPINLAAIGWLPERGVARIAGWTLAVLLVEALLVALLATPELRDVAGRLGRPLVAGYAPSIPAPAAGAFLMALLTGVARVAHFRNAVECGALWTLVAAFLAVAAGGGPGASLALATGGLVLIVSIVETSHAIAYGDELTGLPARRALNEALARLSGDYTIAMVDIDHFKKFNDTYGHDIGDQLLRMVGARLASVAGGGRPFRYGGEEFAVLFPGISLDDTRPYLETLRASVEASGFTLRGRDRPRQKAAAKRPSPHARRVSVTISIGVAESERDRSSAQVLDAADQALYRAKHGGRNCVRA